MIRSGSIKLSVAATLLLAACGQEQSGHRFEAGNFGGVESQTFGLITSACTFGGTGNVDMTLTVNSGETAYVYYRSTDSRVVANGVDGTGADCATTTLGRILINQGTAGIQKVVIDYVNAPALTFFALGTATNAGIALNLGDDAGDQVTIRGTVNADNYMFGRASTGMGISGNINNDANDDITFGTITANTALVVTTGDAADIVSGVGSVATGGVCATCGFPSPMTVWGGAGNDTLTSGAAGTSNTLNGEADDDTFLQQLAFANDVLVGSTGTDTVNYAVRTAALHVDVTLDAVSDDGDRDAGETDRVNADIENVTTGAGNDTVDALLANDPHIFIGNAGNDTLTGADGADTLTGGTGDDVLAGLLGIDTISGGTGIDTISFAHADHVAGVTVTLTAPGSSTTLDVFNLTAGAGTDIENVRGGGGPDSLTGNDQANIIWGGLGADTLDGGDADDAVHGEGGADVSVAGGNGDDVVTGGEGLDLIISGGAGDDIVDAFDTAAANDASVLCGAGNDIAVDDAMDSNVNVDCELTQ